MSDGWEDEVLQLLAAGRKLDAIALIRSETGMSLAESKAFAESLVETTAPQASGNVDELEQEVIARMQESGKIAAIKWYREQRNVGLKDAKLAVEEIATRHGLPTGSGCAGALLLGFDPLATWWLC